LNRASIKKRIKPLYVLVRGVLGGAWGFLYDYYRYLNYSAWTQNPRDNHVRSYLMKMKYHGLEKSLSYQVRRAGAGWNTVFDILDGLVKAKKSGCPDISEDMAAVNVIKKIQSIPEHINSIQADEVEKLLGFCQIPSDSLDHGVKNYSSEDFFKGKLDNPEDFFNTRFSLREYDDCIVSDAVILKAIGLALKTPSVCNRQHWHVYHTNDREVRDAALNLQNGNTPFGDNVPNLFIITVDLKAFVSPIERYQHWVDGGMYSMSLIYALHSLGVASCPLNWSQSPRNDMKLRKVLNIEKHHSIMMFIAAGYPRKDNYVCSSIRKEAYSMLTTLEKTQ
jgi:nitroreductase